MIIKYKLMGHYDAYSYNHRICYENGNLCYENRWLTCLWLCKYDDVIFFIVIDAGQEGEGMDPFVG